MGSVTGMEYSSGTTGLNTRVNGRMISRMVMVSSIMLMVMFIKVIGKMIKQMEKVFLLVLMGGNMKVFGSMIFNMV